MLICANCQNQLPDDKPGLFCRSCGQRLSPENIIHWEGPWYPGKIKCYRLREIRKEIARKNGIVYEPVACTHDGDCLGTCPVCEQEAAYVEGELDRKRREGQTVVLDVRQTVIPPISFDSPPGDQRRMDDGPRGMMKSPYDYEGESLRETAGVPVRPPEATAGIPGKPIPPKKKSFVGRLRDMLSGD